MTSFKEEEISCLFPLNLQMCLYPASGIVSNGVAFV
jgi:hypothetical protein